MTPPGRLSRKQKAALIILAMEESMACEILRHLDEKELVQLVKCVDEMQDVPIEQLDAVLSEFEEQMRKPLMLKSTGSYVRKLAATAIGEQKVKKLLSPTVSSEPLDVIKRARTATLASLLEQEHPQIAAVVLSQLPRQQASQVALALSPEKQIDLIQRVSSLQEVPRREMEMASKALVKALVEAGGLSEEQERTEFDGVAFTAGLLNDMAPDESERILGVIEGQSAHLAPKMRQAMFTFEDLQKITGRALQTLMREVPTDTMLLALKTVDEDMREHFFSAVSSRAAEQMREDLSLLPPARLSDVERAQRDIVDVTLRLAGEGQIVLPTGGGEVLV